MKRYSIQYESDEVVCGSSNHVYCFASTMKSAKRCISMCKAQSDGNPRNFRIYDHESDVDPATGYVPCVYQEA